MKCRYVKRYVTVSRAMQFNKTRKEAKSFKIWEGKHSDHYHPQEGLRFLTKLCLPFSSINMTCKSTLIHQTLSIPRDTDTCQQTPSPLKFIPQITTKATC